MTTTVLRMAGDKHQHRRYHYPATGMMRSGAYPRGVLGHQERVRPTAQDGPRREATMLMRALVFPVTPRDMVCRLHCEIQIKPVLPS
jgi:hypothetical protein